MLRFIACFVITMIIGFTSFARAEYGTGKGPLSYQPRVHLGVIADYENTGEDLVRGVSRGGITPKIDIGIDFDYRVNIDLGIKYWQKEANVFRRKTKSSLTYIELQPGISRYTSGERMVQVGAGLSVPVTLVTVRQGVLTPHPPVSIEMAEENQRTVMAIRPSLGIGVGPLKGIFKLHTEVFYNIPVLSGKTKEDQITKTPAINWSNSQPKWGVSCGLFFYF